MVLKGAGDIGNMQVSLAPLQWYPPYSFLPFLSSSHDLHASTKKELKELGLHQVQSSTQVGERVLQLTGFGHGVKPELHRGRYSGR